LLPLNGLTKDEIGTHQRAGDIEIIFKIYIQMSLSIGRLDLFSDWAGIVKSELEDEGYVVDGLPEQDVSILYFGLQKKLIKPKPRRILRSNGFSCPEELKPGLASLEEKIINGENLRPHLSKKLKNLNDNDGLLFDWGIFHLHLGTVIGSDGFIDRTGPLLYTRFDEANAYFINVIDHGSWTTQELVKTIWPESIKPYILTGVTSISRNFTDKDVKDLRGSQVNTILDLDNGVFTLGPGGGMTASGSSAEAILTHLQTRKWMKRLEKPMKEDITKFLLSLFTDVSFIRNEVLHFVLKKDNETFYIDEINNGFRLALKNKMAASV
jgi:hypothetical protein